jgi:uncharacterized membrane protein SpoIIM required for sporulation
MKQAPLTLKSRRFRMEREADWRRLEEILDLVEAGKRRELTNSEIIALPVLYRSTLSSLSVARAISLDQSLISYLSTLATRAYFCVYGSRSHLLQRAGRFMARDWPRAVFSLWRETAVSGLLLLAGAVAAFLLTNASPDWFYCFIPEGMAQGREPGASTAYLRDSLFKGHGPSGLAFFASILFSHNAQTAMLAFALGFACCLPTAYFLFENGLSLGALLAVYTDHGLGIDFMGWILIHGVTELFAITLAGAAGLRVGWALVFPGDEKRTVALAKAGKTAAVVMIGVVLMLFCAGLLEGIARQLITNTPARYGVAALTAVIWFGFFYSYRGGRHEHG